MPLPPLDPAELVLLPRELTAGLLRQCRARLPREACGVWYGRRDGRLVDVRGFAFVRNAHPYPERAFRFDREEWVRVAYAAQRNRHQLVGFFHSHPNGSLRPSRSDLDAWTGGGVCAIVGLGAGPDEDRLAAYERASGPGASVAGWRQIPIRTD